MTLDDATRLLRVWIPDIRGTYLTDADLHDLLEQAANLVAALTLGYERVQVLTHLDSPQVLEVGVREYPFVSTMAAIGLGLTDVLKVLHVHLDGDALVQMVPEQYSTIDSAAGVSGPPRYWYQFAGRLGVRPTPSAAFLTNYQLDITYAATVGNWTSGESVLPKAFQDLMLPYACAKAQISLGQWGEASQQLEAWISQVQTQVLVVERPITEKGTLPVPSTEARRFRRRSA